MIKGFAASLLLCLCFILQAQSPIEEIKKFQQDLNAEYRDSKTSPLSKKDRKNFTGHDFFEINLSLRVEATFEPLFNQETFKMPATGAVQGEYRKYGLLHFQIEGQQFQLTLYQNLALTNTAEYRDYLFLPFTDLTTGDTTYGGGRYIEFWIPNGETTILDFNQAYNPYCAYNVNYSCPIPPSENHLPIKILAGVKEPIIKY
ncbi:MAG: DUF1684 domain-containing protein [bacterium]|nr:DUF1684 domain-containing protein [bacterium]